VINQRKTLSFSVSAKAPQGSSCQAGQRDERRPAPGIVATSAQLAALRESTAIFDLAIR